jgi:hypothetical protein
MNRHNEIDKNNLSSKWEKLVNNEPTSPSQEDLEPKTDDEIILDFLEFQAELEL